MPNDHHSEHHSGEHHVVSHTQLLFTSRVIFGKESGKKQVPAFATWLIKKKLIKNLSQAKNLFVCLIIVDFVLSGIIDYFHFFVIQRIQ